MDVDQILRDVGEYGRYQQLMLWLVLLPAHLPYGFHSYSQLFMTLTPDHWCASANASDHGRHSCDSSLRNSTQRCLDGVVYDQSRIGHEDTVVTLWDLVCERSWLPPMALTLFEFGGFVGQCVCIAVANRFGRRPTFFLFLGVQCLFGVLTCMAPDFLSFAAFRFMVGLTVSAVVSSPSILAREIVGPSLRIQVWLMSYVARSLGTLILSGIVFLVRDWTHLALVTTVPFSAFFLHWWVLPESPRWLLSRGRYEEADRLLRAIGQSNGKTLPPDYIVNLKRRFRVESVLQDEKKKQKANSIGVVDLFKTPNLCRKTSTIIIIWFTSTATYVGLTYYSLELEGEAHLHFFLSTVAEVMAIFFSTCLLHRLGRRCTLCLCSALGGAASLCIAAVNKGTATALILYFVAKLSISSSCVVLPLWSSELLPIVIRDQGLSMVDAFGLLGPVIMPFIMYQGRRYPIVPLAALGSCQLVGALAASTLPETLHQRVLHTIEDGEEFGKHWTWKDCVRCGPPKLESKNGILKNKGPPPQSPILSLLRRQDSLRCTNSNEGDPDPNECPSEQGSLVETVLVTVL
ncbi:carcinine transporter-like [Centruroides sculpturatus]|uniref:carcinine transporter-like n=1 Tax=Centruroides sculpturatus TaxID=218467 RepID=UPI000C6D3ECB|nr:carcinine transporter-like [Centruroides sculpturatus]